MIGFGIARRVTNTRYGPLKAFSDLPRVVEHFKATAMFRAASQQDCTSARQGTPMFMAPEMILGKA